MSLLTSTQISNATGEFYRHWLTFSSFNTITVNKEPIISFTNLNANVLPGYDNTSNETNQTYTPVSQNFNALVKYPNQNENTLMEDVKISLSDGQCLIKVDQSCRNYINTNKTENIIVDEKTYEVLSEEKIQNYLGLKFYYFKLGKTS